MKNKILIVCNYDWAYNQFLLLLAKKLKKFNTEIHVACSGNDIKNLEILDYHHNIVMPNSINLIKSLKSFFQIRSLIKYYNYNAIISNNRNASFITRLAMLSFKNKAKNIYIARGMYFHDAQNYLFYIISFLIEYLLSFSNDLILSQSKEDINKFINKPFIKNKYIHIGNGVNTDIFINKKNVKENDFIFSTTCRLEKLKNLDYLIYSFSRFCEKINNSKLIIIGGILKQKSTNQDYLNAIIFKCKKLNIYDKVIITGLVDDVEIYLNKSDVYIHPSLREGMPRSILEAMSMENIVLASNIRGAREVIDEGVDGFLFNPYKKDELYKLMLKVYNINDKNRKKIGFFCKKKNNKKL